MRRRWGHHSKRAAPAPRSMSSLEVELKSLEAIKANCEHSLRAALSEQRRRAGERAQLTQLRERLIAQGATTTLLGFSFGHVKSVRLQLSALDDALRSNAAEYVIDGRKWPTIEIAVRSLEQEMAVAMTRYSGVVTEFENLKSKERRKAERAALAAKRERERRDRQEANAHLAARARGEIRSESSRLRSRLRRDHPCPYCGGDLGPDMHADWSGPLVPRTEVD